MSPAAFGTMVALVVLGVSVPVLLGLLALVRWRSGRRRSKIDSIAHQLEGPYRKAGERRRKLCDHLELGTEKSPDGLGYWDARWLAADDPGIKLSLDVVESSGIPEALDCEPDTGPLGFTVIGPFLTPRPPASPRR